MRRTAFALVLLLSLTLPVLTRQAASAGSPPRPAPGITVTTASGAVALDSLRGRVVYVDFWASWCLPCRASFPWLSGLHDRYSAKGLTILAIDLDKDRKAADAFLEEFHPPFLVAFDPAGKSAEAFKVSAMPSSYLIGPTGIILASHTGFDPRKTGKVEALIQEACHP